MSKWDPDIAACWVEVRQIGSGISQYTCFSPNWVGPIGFAWVVRTRGSKKTCARLLFIYTMPWARRRGVASLIHSEILKHADLVVTAEGSPRGGRKFTTWLGYTYNAEFDEYFLLKRQRRARAKGPKAGNRRHK